MHSGSNVMIAEAAEVTEIDVDDMGVGVGVGSMYVGKDSAQSDCVGCAGIWWADADSNGRGGVGCVWGGILVSAPTESFVSITFVFE